MFREMNGVVKFTLKGEGLCNAGGKMRPDRWSDLRKTERAEIKKQRRMEGQQYGRPRRV